MSDIWNFIYNFSFVTLPPESAKCQKKQVHWEGKSKNKYIVFHFISIGVHFPTYCIYSIIVLNCCCSSSKLWLCGGCGRQWWQSGRVILGIQGSGGQSPAHFLSTDWQLDQLQSLDGHETGTVISSLSLFPYSEEELFGPEQLNRKALFNTGQLEPRGSFQTTERGIPGKTQAWKLTLRRKVDPKTPLGRPMPKGFLVTWHSRIKLNAGYSPFIFPMRLVA